MKRILTMTTLALGVAAFAHADDKSRFSLSKFNPLNRFKKDEPGGRFKAAAESLRTDPDEKKRKAAAEELAETDAKHVGDVMPSLIASLKLDPSVSVRSSVATTIGKIKSVVPAAGVVLESAAVNDPSETVRKASQTSLNSYLQNGYRATTSTITETAEPPLAKPRPQMQLTNQKPFVMAPVPSKAPPVVPPAIPSGVNRGPSFQETAEPPFAKRKIDQPKVFVEPVEKPIVPLPTAIPQMPTPATPPTIQIPTPLPTPNAPMMPAPLPLPKDEKSKSPTPPMPIPTPPPSGSPSF